jgi:hypothetical protein
MTTEPEKSTAPPSPTSGNAPDADEIARKGNFAGQGMVPAPPEGSGAPPETLAPDPALATESGVDLSAADDADATTSGGASPPTGPGAKPSVGDIKKADAAMDPAQAVHDYAATKRA